MKTKIVTIENWDGSKYKVKAPVAAKYLGILSHSGAIRFFKTKPKLDPGLGNEYYNAKDCVGEAVYGVCPDENRPCVDGFTRESGLSELVLKIEEA